MPAAGEFGTCIQPFLGVWRSPAFPNDPGVSSDPQPLSPLCWQQFEPFFCPFHSPLCAVGAQSFQPIPLLLGDSSSSLLPNFCPSPALPSCWNCLCDQILRLSPRTPSPLFLLPSAPSAALAHHFCSQLIRFWFFPCSALPTALEDLEHPGHFPA